MGPKGWGLVLQQEAKQGDLVIEYIGEVRVQDSNQLIEKLIISHQIIDSAEMQRRLDEDYRIDKHYYGLTVDSSTFIDASKKGNRSRFINHSCEPNCEVQKW